MKKKLTDNEAGSVSGGTLVACTAEQNAKINQNICPYCGGTLHPYSRGASKITRCFTSSCHKEFIYASNDCWRMDNGESSGC